MRHFHRQTPMRRPRGWPELAAPAQGVHHWNYDIPIDGMYSIMLIIPDRRVNQLGIFQFGETPARVTGNGSVSAPVNEERS